MSPPLLLFDFPPERLAFAHPERVLVAERLEDVRGVLREVERAAAAGLWAAGYVSYEAAPAFDPALQVREGHVLPLAWFGLFRAPVPAPAPAGPSQFGAWEPSVTREAYRAGIDAIREAIAAGETYQLNYTLRLRARLTGDPLAAYEALRAAQRARYCAYLDLGAHRLVSASPELFFERSGERLVTRPMKGTLPRGRWAEEDDARAAWLQASEKNRAENVMIVDLLRNDLGRVAQVGSVQATRLFEVERYPTVLQLTSTVEARARPGTTLEQVFGALFPCGSITGAPKVSTMRLISRLEGRPREVYCGAIGLVRPGGDATFSVAIRTLWQDAASGWAEYGTGGGITWDSTAADEHAEALAKARVLSERWPAFELLETLALRNGEYVLRERHVERVLASARYFGIPLTREQVESALFPLPLGEGKGEGLPKRVRLLVSQQGEVRTEATPLTELPPGPLPIALARAPVSRHDRFLFHKTTHREVYTRHKAEHPEAFDVLLWNEEGELTELTTGNLVLELPDGRKLTPPRDCGLLAGTLREELLSRGEIEEQVLTREDLGRAQRLWFINGVRGWVEVSLR
ncbi:aminodeoxychorismate synthase component I [Aggregicoccus sp. 17bor-14]|uniref:aminodeoxychorismate synthase component I n=1 Tax=Myxococcaceae TaxID=31 RepID=UPI00129CB3F6|nr:MULTISPECIES: aminodeoxychorismate synthase component I [Myxococcaceae]MBF5045200.1 aminodeoxychorismate synthase component I [Simulacricoccus sp. 17bor-14]MRI90941.1 aminodeoxychorismate synthase component I [Aggregicoccus sp. 17bor-14]